MHMESFLLCKERLQYDKIFVMGIEKNLGYNELVGEF